MSSIQTGYVSNINTAAPGARLVFVATAAVHDAIIAFAEERGLMDAPLFDIQKLWLEHQKSKMH